MKYLYNKEKNIVKFYSNQKWKKEMVALENFYNVFTKGALLFSGDIDIERFVVAMNESFKEFHYLLSKLYKENNNIYAVYSPKEECEEKEEEENYQDYQLEIEEINESISNGNSTKLDVLLPSTKILNKIQHSGFTPNIDGLKMSSFKLTKFKNGFSIGYNISHTLFDQSSIVYYFKYLSKLYSFGSNSQINKPKIIDVFSLVDSISNFTELDIGRDYGNRVLGFKYLSYNNNNNDSNNNNESVDYFSLNKIVKLKFNLNEIDKLKSKFSNNSNNNIQYLSKNDIITSILLKVYTFTTNYLSNDQLFTIRYAINIRKYLGLSEESIGVLFHERYFTLKVSDIQEKDILELAQINRNDVSQISGDHFKSNLSWFKFVQDNGESLFDYIAKASFISTNVSNWTSFDYSGIKFDSSSPFSLKSHCIAEFGVNTISFDIENDNKIFSTFISIPDDSIQKLEELRNCSKLFSFNILKSN